LGSSTKNKETPINPSASHFKLHYWGVKKCHLIDPLTFFSYGFDIGYTAFHCYLLIILLLLPEYGDIVCWLERLYLNLFFYKVVYDLALYDDSFIKKITQHKGYYIIYNDRVNIYLKNKEDICYLKLSL
jgi:hypothetical protein